MASAKETRDGTLHVYNVPPRDPKLSERLLRYQQVRHASFAGFDDYAVEGNTGAAGDEGGIYVATRFGDAQQIHAVNFPLGMREQLTFLKEPVKLCLVPPPPPLNVGSSFPATTSGFMYGVDNGGDERTQYWFFHRNTGEAKLLTDGESSHRSPKFCRNATSSPCSLAFSSNARDGEHFDVYILDNFNGGANGEKIVAQKMVYCAGEMPGYMMVEDFYSEGLLVIRHYVSVSDSKLFVLRRNEEGAPAAAAGDEELSQWERIDVTDPEDASAASPDEEAALSDGVFTPNGKGLFYASDRGTEFKTLRFFDLQSRKGYAVPTPVNWDVEDIVVSDFGDLVVVYNEDGVSTVYHGKLDNSLAGLERISVAVSNILAQSLRKVQLQGLALGIIGRCEFRPGSRFFAFSYAQATGPNDVFSIDFGDSSAVDEQGGDHVVRPVRWTKSEVGGLDSKNFVAPSLIRYKSFDGLEIPAFVYYPSTRKTSKQGENSDTKTKKVPVIIHPHGGPEGQHRPRFAAIYQYLAVEMGICVIDPNVRGSSGFGKKFVTLDDGRKREDSVRDIGALIDWICAQQKDTLTSSSASNGAGYNEQYDFDPARVAVWGGSYGGYMVLASLIHFNEKLRCGVDMVGISNFVTFLENTAPYRRKLRRKKYGDESDPAMREFLLEISPLTNCDKIKAALFIAQGKNDPRVPASEADQIFDKVRERNGDDKVWYMLADDEGHGFSKKKNVDAYQEAMVRFWQKWLLDGGGDCNAEGTTNVSNGGSTRKAEKDGRCCL
eukprot:g11528.t1